MTNGAKLESPTTVTVTIETSDDPGGLFGFVNSSELSLVNPSKSKDLNFVIQREGGAEGEVEVSESMIGKLTFLNNYRPNSRWLVVGILVLNLTKRKWGKEEKDPGLSLEFFFIPSKFHIDSLSKGRLFSEMTKSKLNSNCFLKKQVLLIHLGENTCIAV